MAPATPLPQVGLAVLSAVLAVAGAGLLWDDEDDLSALLLQAGRLRVPRFRLAVVACWVGSGVALLAAFTRPHVAWLVVTSAALFANVNLSSPAAWASLDLCRLENERRCTSGAVLLNLAMVAAVGATAVPRDDARSPRRVTLCAFVGLVLMLISGVTYWQSDLLGRRNAFRAPAWATVAEVTVLLALTAVAVYLNRLEFTAAALAANAISVFSLVQETLDAQAGRQTGGDGASNLIWSAQLCGTFGSALATVALAMSLFKAVPKYERVYVALPSVSVACAAILSIVGTILLWNIESFGITFTLNESRSLESRGLWRVSVLFGWVPAALAIGNLARPHPVWAVLCFGMLQAFSVDVGALQYESVDACRREAQEDISQNDNDLSNCTAGGVLAHAGILMALLVVVPNVRSAGTLVNRGLALAAALLGFIASCLLWASNDMHLDGFRTAAWAVASLSMLPVGFFVLAVALTSDKTLASGVLFLSVVALLSVPQTGLVALDQAGSVSADEEAGVALASLGALAAVLSTLYLLLNETEFESVVLPKVQQRPPAPQSSSRAFVAAPTQRAPQGTLPVASTMPMTLS